MKEMIGELEEKLKEAKNQQKDWEAKEKFWTEAVKTAQKELTILKDDIGNLEMMIEAAKGMHHNYGDAEKKKENKETKKEIEIDPNHRKAMVFQINQYDNIENRWKTQHDCAKGLGIDQSTISKLMKMDKSEQIRRRGFALVWQY